MIAICFLLLACSDPAGDVTPTSAKPIDVRVEGDADLYRATIGRFTKPSPGAGCLDRAAPSGSLIAGGFFVEEGHSGGYAACTDANTLFVVGSIGHPNELSLETKLQDDADARPGTGQGRWTKGTTLSGHPAQEEHRASPGLDGDNAVRRARFVLHEGKLYIAAIISEDPDSAEATALLDSVVFNDLSPAK
jgi:hypothetical protein